MTDNIVKQPLLPDTIHFNHTMQNKNTEVMRITRDGVWVNPDIPVKEAAKAVLDALDSQIKVLVQSAQREWVGLTEDDIEEAINANCGTGLWSMAKDIEDKLKEKNT